MKQGSSRHTDVCRLADEGLAVPEIATSSGLSEGEVELILGLRKKQ